MLTNPIVFGSLLALSIVCLIGWAAMFVNWYKNGRTHTSHFYYSDNMPPLTREQFIEMTGDDPIALMKKHR